MSAVDRHATPRVPHRTATSFQVHDLVVGIVQLGSLCIAPSSAQRRASFDVFGIGIGLGTIPFSERANRSD